MPKVPLTPENRSTNSWEFPKLFLEKGERARIALLDPTPQTEYVHTLRAPQIQNGKVVKEWVERRGEKVHQTIYDFVGRPLCLGDFDTIAAKGSDPGQCPICEAAKQTSAVNAPERRHALNVLAYQLQPGGFSVREPFGLDLKVWAFADGVHSTLIDAAEEWGDLRAHDLLLGPCQVKQYQKMDINVAAKAEWASTEERQELAKQVYQNNALEDLAVACGRKNSREQVLEDLSRVLEKDKEAQAIESGQAKPQDPPSWAVDQVDVSGILPDSGHVGEDTPGTVAEDTPKETKADVLDLDDFLHIK